MALTTVPYVFQHNYCRNFFNFTKATLVERQTVERDFVRNLLRLLERLHVPAAIPIATSLYARMADNHLFYHTPVHILSILQFATVNEIRMAWWEELAVWFHDAIYVPNAKPGTNEWASSKFMEAMLGPFITNNRLNWISMAITQTAQHLAPSLPGSYSLILDLDISTFSFESPGRVIAAYCILMELEQYYPKAEMLEGRLEFLVKLLRRGIPIYRSRTFKPFIQDATEYLIQQVIDTRSDLEFFKGTKSVEEQLC